MVDSAAAFANFPSEARGILQVDTYDPISLHTADVHVLLSGYAAQVTLSLEYVNETNRLVKAIAAYPVPPGFQLQYITLTGPNRAITNNVYQQSRELKTTEVGSELPTKSHYDIMTSAVATQTVPWDISPGDSILMTSVYHAPLGQIQRHTEISFTMPTSLFPAVVRPPEEQCNYVKTADDRSSNKRVGKPGWFYLTVEGQLYRPLRGHVTLDKGGYIVVPEGGEKLKVTYSGDSGFYLTYQSMLPKKAYTQQPLTVHAPVGDNMEPLRLHSVTVPSAESATAPVAVALTMAPNFADCPVNAELVFLVDAHTATMAQDVAQAVAAVISPALSPLPDTVLANVFICSDTRRNGCVALFPTGSVPISNIPQASLLAYMKEEIALSTTKEKKSTLAPAAVYSPQLPAVLRDVLAGRNRATAVPDGYVRNVILLSDAGGLAEPSQSAAMVCDAANFATNTRVHCVALGPTADHAVLETLALSAGGRYRNLANTAVPASANFLPNSDLVSTLRQVLAAAAVPCLAQIRTLWKLVSKSRTKMVPAATVGTIRLAADANGTGLPCIPRNTKRVLYGLIVPTESSPEQQSDRIASTAQVNENAKVAVEGEDAPLLQLNVRVIGRVGKLSLEFTASALVTRTADVICAAQAAGPVDPAASDGTPIAALNRNDELTMIHKDVATKTNCTVEAGEEERQQSPQPKYSSTTDTTPQEHRASVSTERDSVSAGSVNRVPADVAAATTLTSPSNSPVKRNGKTLLLHTAAAAARIAYLSNGTHSVSTAEAQEMLELSRACMLPTPYTTLTDGKAPLSAIQKKGGVVYMPSVGAKAQMALAIRTRQAEAAAVAPPTLSKADGKPKGGKSSDKDKKDKKKDTVSLYSTS